MDTRLIDKNGVVVVEECPFPKPGATIQHPTLPVAYRPLKDFSPELRLLDIGRGMGKKWYHVVTVEPVSEAPTLESHPRPPAIKSLEHESPIHHKVGF